MLQRCGILYWKISVNCFEKYGETLTTIGSIGFSAMMHGYMAFDKNDELLVSPSKCLQVNKSKFRSPAYFPIRSPQQQSEPNRIPIDTKEMIAKTKLDIMDGRTALGIEFGSTRIKVKYFGRHFAIAYS
jgi:hypothetical protein